MYVNAPLYGTFEVRDKKQKLMVVRKMCKDKDKSKYKEKDRDKN